jgi:hypothetical protein
MWGWVGEGGGRGDVSTASARKKAVLMPCSYRKWWGLEIFSRYKSKCKCSVLLYNNMNPAVHLLLAFMRFMTYDFFYHYCACVYTGELQGKCK